MDREVRGISDFMKFSVITVCFNSEKTIKRTLESMINQTFQDFEYIIIDGKSTDATLDIIESYREAFGEKLRIVSEADTGIYNAMNKGIAMSRGDIIGIINSDDCYENDALEKISNAYDGGSKQILHGMTRVFVDGVETQVVLRRAELLDKWMIYHPSCFVTRDVYDTYGGFDERYKLAADYDFMLRMKETGEVRFVPVYQIVASFYDGSYSSTIQSQKEGFMVKRNHGQMGLVIYWLKMMNARLNSLFKGKIWS